MVDIHLYVNEVNLLFPLGKCICFGLFGFALQSMKGQYVVWSWYPFRLCLFDLPDFDTPPSHKRPEGIAFS